jgi:probable F420-dependent oxidoreductase
MKIGVSTTISSDSEDVAAMAQKAEEVGFDSFWLPEHAIIPVHTDSRYGGTSDGSIPASMSDMGDPFIGLARASATTSKIMLGTAVCLVPEHNPLVQAKQIAALDFHSGGRFIFGVGTGWLREETEIMGGDFDHRWTQTREAIEVMKALWTEDEAEYHGRYYDFPALKVYPKPAQKPHPPVFLGGSAKNVFKRVVAYADGWMPVRATPDQIRAGRASLDELAAAAGRDPKNIQILIYGPADLDEIRRMEDAGANLAAVRIPTAAPGEALPAIEQLAEELLG